MKVGDLVVHDFRGNELGRVPASKQIGIITHVSPCPSWAISSSVVSVLFADGEYDVDKCDCEVISESR